MINRQLISRHGFLDRSRSYMYVWPRVKTIAHGTALSLYYQCRSHLVHTANLIEWRQHHCVIPAEVHTADQYHFIIHGTT